MVAEIQRLENAARIALGDVQEPAQTTRQSRPLSPASISLVIAVLAVVAAGFVAYSDLTPSDTHLPDRPCGGRPC